VGGAGVSVGASAGVAVSTSTVGIEVSVVTGDSSVCVGAVSGRGPAIGIQAVSTHSAIKKTPKNFFGIENHPFSTNLSLFSTAFRFTINHKTIRANITIPLAAFQRLQN
jgi:hypothetical protein